jgi:hypothetical protein
MMIYFASGPNDAHLLSHAPPWLLPSRWGRGDGARLYLSRLLPRALSRSRYKEPGRRLLGYASSLATSPPVHPLAVSLTAVVCASRSARSHILRRAFMYGGMFHLSSVPFPAMPVLTFDCRHPFLPSQYSGCATTPGTTISMLRV